MKSAVYFFLGLILGAAGGAYVANYISEKKADEQIEKATLEAKEFYKAKYEKKEEPVKKDPPKDFSRIYGPQYEVYRTEEDNHVEPDPGAETYSYRIDPDDFGVDNEYTTYTLDYYTDGNLVDETGNIVDDPVHLVGGDVLDDLSKDEPVAYVRNDITKTDYEICYVDDVYEISGGDKD